MAQRSLVSFNRNLSKSKFPKKLFVPMRGVPSVEMKGLLVDARAQWRSQDYLSPWSEHASNFTNHLDWFGMVLEDLGTQNSIKARRGDGNFRGVAYEINYAILAAAHL